MAEHYTVTLADGLTVTVRRGTVRDVAHMNSLGQRFDEHFAAFGREIESHWTIYKVCATHTVKVEGVDWTPPSIFSSIVDIEINLQAWLDILPTFDAASKWLNAVTQMGEALVPEELTPNAKLDDTDPKAPKD